MKKPFELEYDHLKYLDDIYKDGKEVNPIPEDRKVTIYFESSSEEGYLTDVFKYDAGLELLIAKKWQYQEVLEDLINKENETQL